MLVVTTLAELDPAARRKLAPSIRYTGPVWQDTPDPRSSAPDEPLVLVSLSTTNFEGQPKALQSILDALAPMPVRAVVTTGPSIDLSPLRPGSNTEIHRYVDHSELMPKTSLVIGHGGHATTIRALAHSLPLVVMPMHPFLDQRMIGRAVESAGAARVLPKSAKPLAIRSAAQNLLDDHRYRAAAARLGATVLKRDGAEQAADDLAALLTSQTAGRSRDWHGSAAPHGSPGVQEEPGLDAATLHDPYPTVQPRRATGASTE